MADNTTINAGSGGDTLRTDDLGTVKVPVSKIMLGGDGLDLGFVTGTNPFPVQSMSGSQTGLLMGANPVAASNPLAVTSISGSQIGILVGSNPVAASNPLPVTSISGSQIGILIGSNPAAISNPVPTRPTSDQSGQVLSGSFVRVVRYASGNATVSGSANQLIAPQGANNKIRVLSAHVMSVSSVIAKWLSTGSAGTITSLSGYIPVAGNGGFVLPHNPHGWFETNADEGLNLSLSAAGNLGFYLTYIIAGNTSS